MPQIARSVKDNEAVTGICVELDQSEYLLYNPIELTNAHTGGKNLIFTSSREGETVALSGGVQIKGFELFDRAKDIYRAPVQAGVNSRQLYVDGVKAVRARSKGELSDCTNLGKTSQEWGLLTSDISIMDYKYPIEIELKFHDKWTCRMVMPDFVQKYSEDRVKIGFNVSYETPYSFWHNFIYNNNTPIDTPVYIENAYELLDECGEWYLDTHENYIYYKPRPFENIKTAKVILPVTEQLIVMNGTEDEPVSNISFENIEFKSTTWNRPTELKGWDGQQNFICGRLSSTGSLIDGAVELNNIQNIDFTGCKFDQIGSIGLKMIGVVKDCDITLCEFYDISGSAYALGEVGYGEIRQTNKIENINFTNNYIHGVAKDYHSASAISLGYPTKTVIKNNELCDGSYSGMHIGYGWTSEEECIISDVDIENNYIHDFLNSDLYDGGGIYTLGSTGGTEDNPNTIKGNYIKDIKGGYGPIYPDEGSSYWHVSDNVIDQKDYNSWYIEHTGETVPAYWIHNWSTTTRYITCDTNYSTTSETRFSWSAPDKGYGIGNLYKAPEVYPEAHWPQMALDIINNSGIEESKRSHFDSLCEK